MTDAEGTAPTNTPGPPPGGAPSTLAIEEPRPAQNAPPPHKAGDILGAYKIVDLLGEGGMGFVFAAEHQRLGRRVALKMLRPEYAQNAQAVARFFGEARAVNQINHPHIVEITDFVENEGQDKYYIMELLRGSSLQQQAETGERLGLGRALDIAQQTSDALAAVHRAGIVHRDLKPDNIFLCERDGKTDYVKLLDFGVAKLSDSPHAGDTSRTAVGAILGTPEYMSPEQAGGGRLDYRSDIYSLGVILYELVSGTKPFRGNSFGEFVVQHLTVRPPPPSMSANLLAAIPEPLEQLIMRCLEKEPSKRPQSMDEVTATLERIRSEEALDAPPPKHRIRLSRRTTMIVGGAVIAALAVSLTWVLVRPGPAPVAAAASESPAAAPAAGPAPATAAGAINSPPAGADAAVPNKAKPPRTKKERRSKGLDRGAVLDPFGDD